MNLTHMKARLLTPVETFAGVLPAGTVLELLSEHRDGAGCRVVTLGRGERIVVSELGAERVERIEDE